MFVCVCVFLVFFFLGEKYVCVIFFSSVLVGKSYKISFSLFIPTFCFDGGIFKALGLTE